MSESAFSTLWKAASFALLATLLFFTRIPFIFTSWATMVGVFTFVAFLGSLKAAFFATLALPLVFFLTLTFGTYLSARDAERLQKQSKPGQTDGG